MQLLSRIFSTGIRTPHFRNLLAGRFRSASPVEVRHTQGSDWPPAAAFHSLSAFAELTDGKVHGARLAVCDATGTARTRFEVGEAIHVYLEFQILEEIGVPWPAIELGDGAEQTYLTAGDFPSNTATIAAGSILRFHHQIFADTSPGPVFIDIGLSSASPADTACYQTGELTRDEFELRCTYLFTAPSGAGVGHAVIAGGARTKPAGRACVGGP